MAGSMFAIFPILRPSPPVFTPPAARFKIEWVLIAIRGKLLSPSAISVPIEIPMESFNNFGIVQMGPDFSPVLRQIIITHSLVPRVLRLNHRQLRSCRFLGFLLLMYVRPQVVRQWDQDAKARRANLWQHNITNQFVQASALRSSASKTSVFRTKNSQPMGYQDRMWTRA